MELSQDENGKVWCLDVGGKLQGPYSETQVRLGLKQGEMLLFAGERLAAKGRVTVVAFDTKTRRSCRLPEHWQASNYNSPSY